MQVKLYASLRQAAGTKMLEVEISSTTTTREILLEVTNQFPVLVKFIWKEGGDLSEHAHVFINGENVHHLNGLETILKSDDHIDIFPPVVGGKILLDH
jgi:molybdopterin synthase sulfur carrier subunit